MPSAIKDPVKVATPSDVLPLSEAAGYLRVEEESLRRMATESAVPAQKIGDEWRFLRGALDAWLAHGSASTPTRLRWVPVLPELELEPLLAELERRLLSSLSRAERVPSKEESKRRLLELAGSWKDDPTAEEMLREIYRRRGRPMTEGGA